MKQLTANFNLAEFSCNDEKHTPVPEEYHANAQELANNLQVLRDYLDSALHINSAYRTEAYNKKVGGAPMSQHKVCKAADVTSKKYTPDQIYTAILLLISQGKMKNGGVGRYDTFIHYDIGHTRRWDLRKHKAH